MREELQSLQRQVIRQERLAAVGQLVSGVAHEINNPLQAILGFAELLQMQADVPDSVKGDLRLIQKESARACNIIRNLAMFARQQPGEAAPVRLDRRHHLGRRTAPAAPGIGADRAARRRSFDAVRAGGAHRTPAGAAEFRRQCGAGDPGVRPAPRAHHHPRVDRRRPGDARSRGYRPWHSDATTKPSCSNHSSRRSPSARAPALVCRSATASSTRSADASGIATRPPAAPSSTSTSRASVEAA